VLKSLSKAELREYAKLMSADDFVHNRVLRTRLGMHRGKGRSLESVAPGQLSKSLVSMGKWDSQELASSVDIPLLVSLAPFCNAWVAAAASPLAELLGMPRAGRRCPAALLCCSGSRSAPAAPPAPAADPARRPPPTHPPRSVPIDAVEAQASDENLPERLPCTGVRRTQAEHVLRQLLHAVPPQTLQNAIRTMNQAVFPVLEAHGAVDLALLLGVTAMLCDAPLQRRCASARGAARGWRRRQRPAGPWPWPCTACQRRRAGRGSSSGPS
jgi:hypothetical protein